LVALNTATGEVLVDKSSSLSNDPISAVLRVIEKAGVPAEEVDLFIHGTTVATNALIQRRGTRVCYVTNRGFRDAIFIQNANRRDLYSLEWKKPRPLASRYDCIEVDCRIDAGGSVVRPLDDGDTERLIEHLHKEGIRSVAISFLFSFMNPEHELQLADRLRREIPGISLSLSHEVYPRWRENDRGHTTIADAYLKPMFSKYAQNLGGGLAAAGSPARLLVMKSNGGAVEASRAAEQPVNYLVSGPVGGVLGGIHFASLAGIDQVMTIDIGGTSCDVSLIENARPKWSSNFEMDFGMPVKAPMVDIRTIGAGGGSIAWIDPGGLLRVGPQSAGSDPGPVCYARDGTQPTLSDANLVLGRLNPDNFCGGDIPLDVDLASDALGRLSAELDQTLEDTAQAIIELADHNMVDALAVISIERGLDPRDFTLVAFGGAGALHACNIASIAGIKQVLVPPYPGNTSAYGLLTAGLRTDLGTTLLVRTDDDDVLARLNDALVPLRQRTVDTLRREGFEGEPVVLQQLEMRYYGQNYHREVAIVPHAPISQADFEASIEAFHADYRGFYGYEQRDEVIEIVGVSVTAAGGRGDVVPGFSEFGRDLDAPESVRQVFFAPGGFEETTIVQRSALSSGMKRLGPLIIEEALSTTLVPPGAQVMVHESGSLVIALPEEVQA
jgi:N-methylhydantoinase A